MLVDTKHNLSGFQQSTLTRRQEWFVSRLFCKADRGLMLLPRPV
jgi:hypothetical protein